MSRAKMRATTYHDIYDLMFKDRITSIKLGYATQAILHRDESISIIHHSTEIVRFYQSGNIYFTMGGYDTVTTRDRISQFTGLPVWRCKGKTYIANSEEDCYIESHPRYMIYSSGLIVRLS